MGKVKIKKSDVWIDMTPMSDVMVLLLTFFMLTSTFVKQEPVKVVTPGSVSELKVPDVDVLTILVDKSGKIFMSLDKTSDLEAALTTMTGNHNVGLSADQIKKFKNDPMFGVPMDKLSSYLQLPQSQMSEKIKTYGIPTDSINGGMSEFQQWVDAVRQNNDQIKICIKADENTPYATVKKIMSELQNMDENRYNLITSYKKQED